jgi:hypothetical protein
MFCQSREVTRETLDGQVKATTYLFSKGPRLQVKGVRNLCFRDDSAVLAMVNTKPQTLFLETLEVDL